MLQELTLADLRKSLARADVVATTTVTRRTRRSSVGSLSTSGQRYAARGFAEAASLRTSKDG